LLSIISKKFLYRLNTRKSNFLICEIIHISKKRL